GRRGVRARLRDGRLRNGGGRGGWACRRIGEELRVLRRGQRRAELIVRLGGVELRVRVAERGDGLQVRLRRTGLPSLRRVEGVVRLSDRSLHLAAEGRVDRRSGGLRRGHRRGLLRL